ncbi:MAG: chromosomal replication initiator protein DnaA [candidate division Zixibacteria bacterium]|nr:chromosomal replication initiator protein DnaA [candidate division Zixibacteria bacterium]
MLSIQDHRKVWDDCLVYLSHRIKKQSYSTWMRHTRCVSDGNGGIQIVVPNRFVAEWIEEHYAPLIAEALAQICGQPVPYKFLVDQDDQAQVELELPHQSCESPVLREPEKPSVPVRLQSGMLNERYTFDNLVVGNFNEFPYAAAQAVAEAPGLTKYNPLYIYGGVGLGKTHLIQGIGCHVLTHQPAKRVIYATSEKFTSDFINSISSNTITDFINLYRSVDILLIDDCQFFAGKESTQEQFFHTFNALYNAGKQIVLTSDRPPKDIKGMEERLLSRFSWGLVTDIQPPDLETRIAILRRKVESENIFIAEDVVAYIADSVTSNIRELEGSLIRLLAYASLRQQEITLELARKVLSDTFGHHRPTVSISVIRKKVAQEFEVEEEALSAKLKTQHVALARQAAMYLCRSLTGCSLKAIGDAFGGRDHSTVIHACNLVERLITKDPDFRQRLDKVKRAVGV